MDVRGEHLGLRAGDPSIRAPQILPLSDPEIPPRAKAGKSASRFRPQPLFSRSGCRPSARPKYRGPGRRGLPLPRGAHLRCSHKPSLYKRPKICPYAPDINDSAMPDSVPSIGRNLRERERISSLLTQDGMDGRTGVAPICPMGQALPSERCEHCGVLMVLVAPVDGNGPRVLRCLERDEIDPLELPSTTA